MKGRFLTAVVMLALCLTSFMLVLSASHPQVADAEGVETMPTPLPLVTPTPQPLDLLASTACAVQPEVGNERTRRQAMLERRSKLLASNAVDLTRFRSLKPTAAENEANAAVDRVKATTGFVPRETIALIDPTNYGDRYLKDINGNPANLEPLVVLHETVGSATSAISLFQTFHLNEDDQASYHTLIKQDGTVVYLMPPDKRAFGAGNSVFVGANGPEAVKTNAAFPPSVNNFAYHISLETPYDGNNNGSRHSGYTQAQYQSLAWLVSKTGVDEARITTHKAVDRSRSRLDPRSFSNATFFALLKTFPKTAEITIRCTEPVV